MDGSKLGHNKSEAQQTLIVCIFAAAIWTNWKFYKVDEMIGFKGQMDWIGKGGEAKVRITSSSIAVFIIVSGIRCSRYCFQ